MGQEQQQQRQQQQQQQMQTQDWEVQKAQTRMQRVVASFDALSAEEKRIVAADIARRAGDL